MMTSLFWLATAGILAYGALLTWQVIWSRSDTYRRACVVFGFILMVPAVIVVHLTLLGHHRPMTWESARHMAEGDLRAKILGHKMKYGEAIYLYLDRPGEPLALVLPWNDKVAEDLQEAMRGEGEPWIVLPYEWSWDEKRRPKFDVIPPPKMPDKPLEERKAPTYERGAEKSWQNTSGPRTMTT